MENAGLSLYGLNGSQTSASVGSMSAEPTDTQTQDVESLSQCMVTRTSRALLSNRLSYFVDWHKSLYISRHRTLFKFSGSNLILGPDAYLAATSLHLLSPSGKSQIWDQAADGYARGEGICASFMKTLSQALRDGDRIDALIRETCINSDSRTKGIAMPSTEAQMPLISTAYRNAGLDILRAEDRPQYIEEHGWKLRDSESSISPYRVAMTWLTTELCKVLAHRLEIPEEAFALSHTLFSKGYDHGHRPTMIVGSFKTIIGHTEGSMYFEPFTQVRN